MAFQRCSIFYPIPEDHYLIGLNPRFEGNKIISSELLQEQIRTKENKRIGIGKPYLNLYYLAQIIESDTGKWKQIYLLIDKDTSALKDLLLWIRTNLTEEPAYLDTAILKEDIENLKNFYFSKGFFHAHIQVLVKSLPWDPRQVEIIFQTQEGNRAYITQIHYLSPDSQLVYLIQQHQKEAPISIGAPYDEEKLNAYRIWIAELLRNYGYYTLSANDISFMVDTTLAVRKKATQQYLFFGEIGNPQLFTQFPISLTVVLPQKIDPYYIDTVKIFIEDALPSSYGFREISDSFLTQQNCHLFIQYESRVEKVLRLDKFRSYIPLCPPELYREEKMNLIKRQLLNLDLFNLITWDHQVNDSTHSIYSTLYLRLKQRFQFQIGLEGFQSQDVQLNSNLPGFGGQISFINQNLFGLGEKLELFSRGNIRFYQPDPTLPPQFFFQYNQSVHLKFPRLWIIEPLIKKYGAFLINDIQSPFTSFSSSWTTENRPEFSRSFFTGVFQYTFFHVYKNNWYFSHRISPFQITRVQSRLSPGFQNVLEELPAITRNFIIRDYTPRLNTSSAYQLSISYHYADLSSFKKGYFIIFEWESGGNIPYLIDYFQNQNKLRGDGSYKDGLIDGTFQYGQFWRIRLDWRYRYVLSPQTVVALTTQIGIAQGWNYTIRVPFDYRFFAGGINIMRGWQSSTLGPGTFAPDTLTNLIIAGGEYLFLFAIELRQSLFSPLELALFLEAGNTWFSKRSQFQDPRGFLTRENLKLGWDTGIGFRFNFDYFLLRFDLAQQLYAPDLQEFIIHSLKDIGGDRWQFNFGIGYPF